MLNEDTICAISTPPGNGAIAVIRLSGSNALTIAEKVFQPSKKGKILSNQKANTIHHGLIKEDDTIIDDVMVNIFRSPNSYTGEDVVEISCHGSLYIQKKTLEILTNSGARLAKPGEFTMRAFLNGKMDLSQAEAVADLIAGSSRAAHDVAINHMRGGFKDLIKSLRDQLLSFTSLIELELDFSEEDVEFADRKELMELVKKIIKLINSLIESFKLGNVIKHGVPVAITGKPNVGKSTLLNALLHEERAIVSEIAGTTRDVIEDVITIEGFSFRFIDTAGLRKVTDTIETIGIEKTFQKIDQAYIVLYVIDATENTQEIDRLAGKIKKRLEGKDKKLIIILNKVDMLNERKLSELKDLRNFSNFDSDDRILYISAFYNENIDQLASLLLSIVKQRDTGEHDVIVSNTRHYEALTKAREALERVSEGMKTGITGDFLAMDIREALHYLGEITGEVTTDEILGNIFSKFCIGK